MAYIYLDESGDLGFDSSKQKTSKYFVISVLFISSEKEKKGVDKIIKKIFRGFTKREIKHHPNTLHCFKEKPVTRLRLLRLLKEKDVYVMSIYLNKSKVYSRLQDEKQVLYNYVTNILLDRIFTKKLIPLDEKIYLVASRRETNKFLNENFAQYLEHQSSLNHKVKIDIHIRAPHEDKSLQVVDFVCWSIYKKLEHGDSSYVDIIQSKIVEENPLFP